MENKEEVKNKRTSQKVWSVILSIVTFGYFVPTTVAIYKNRKNTGAIFVLNFFLGWTLIGWVVAFVWAMAEEK